MRLSGAHAIGDPLDVRAGGLADRGDGVDVGNLEGEETVGRVLDQLGRVEVGEHDRRVERLRKSPSFAGTARSEETPTTMRSGFIKSSTAEPSRRNSGLLTTSMSAPGLQRLMVWATFSPVLTGTRALVHDDAVFLFNVDARSSRATPSTKLKSTLPSGWGGVGTAMKMTLEAVTASPMEGGEGKPTRGPRSSSPILPGPVRRWGSGRPAVDGLFEIVIDAYYAMAHFREARPCDQSDVTGSDNGKVHIGAHCAYLPGEGQELGYTLGV